MEWRLGRTVLRLDYSFLWMLTLAAWVQNPLLWQVLLFALLHECGHLAALACLGLHPGKLTFSFYGMALQYHQVPNRWSETAVLIGGPAVNLVLWVVLRDSVNSALFLLNMLPVYPLDGGRLAALWLPRPFARGLNALLLVGLVGAGGYVLLHGGGVSLLGIGLYLLLSNLRSV